MGFSFKMGYFAPDDYTALKNLTKTEKTLLDQNIYNSWDGKTLTIDTENLNLKSIEEAIKTKSSKEEAEKIAGMMVIYLKEIGTTLKFENPIKSISGKHDWVKQIDDHSIRIQNLKTLMKRLLSLQNKVKTT